MSFSYDPSTGSARDKLRLMIADTNASDYIYEDAELDLYLSMESQDPQLAAAKAIRTIAVDKARMAIFYRINGFNGFELDRRQVAKDLLEAAKAIEESAKTTPFEFESIMQWWVGADGVDRTSYADESFPGLA